MVLINVEIDKKIKVDLGNCVYLHIYTNSNKYVGASNDPLRRVRKGLNIDSNTGKAVYDKHTSTYNSKVINTYNKHRLKEIKCLHHGLSIEERDLLEIKEIKNNNTFNTEYGGLNPNGLNMSEGGGCSLISMKGRSFSDDHKKKLSESNKGKHNHKIEKNPMYDKNKDKKEKAIILASLGYKHQFIADILDFKSRSSISGWIKGNNIGSIDLNELKAITAFLNRYPCNKAFLLVNRRLH